MHAFDRRTDRQTDGQPAATTATAAVAATDDDDDDDDDDDGKNTSSVKCIHDATPAAASTITYLLTYFFI